MRPRFARTFALLLAAAAARPAAAAQPQFWKVEDARDFLDGDTEGLSIDSDGRVRLAPSSKLLHDPESPYVWSLVRDPKGRVFAGTGNEGKVFAIDGGKGTLFFDAAELEVHALAWGPDGKLYVGTSPDGKVYAVDSSGKSETFFDPSEKYVWALAFDKGGRLYVATGAEGKVYRVDREGKGVVVLTSGETHITALAADGDTIYAGSAPGGILYRIDAQGHVFVLHDSPYREVKALQPGPDGSLYAAVVDGREKDEAARTAAAVTPVPAATGGAEVTVTETFGPITAAPPTAAAPPSPATLSAPRTGPTKGAVLRVMPSGEVDTLWSSSEETPHALAPAKGGGVWMGTGNKGQVYRLQDDRTWAMVATLPAEQVTALHRSGDLVVAATSNPGRVHALDSSLATTGTFTSKVKDTETVSTWGSLRWDQTTPSGTHLEVQTRSGNTSSPDTTWTDWSPVYARPEGNTVTSERARFLQLRVTLKGTESASPVLEALSVAYLQRNLRPQVQSIMVHPAGEVFQKPLSLTGEVEILGLEPGSLPDRTPGAAAAKAALPPATSYSRKLYQKGVQTFSWKADDPNGDTLSYDVEYRRVGDNRFRVLRRGLTEPVMAWDTTTVPNGRYVVKIVASDSPSNPEALALTADKESSAFEVDNTPPVVSAQVLQKAPLRIRVNVKDDGSPVRRVEYSVDGGNWEEVHPLDGISDTPEEAYEFAPPALTPPGPHMIVVRAIDLLGNLASARVEVP